jgi:hypothetical protein
MGEEIFTIYMYTFLCKKEKEENLPFLVVCEDGARLRFRELPCSNK